MQDYDMDLYTLHFLQFLSEGLIKLGENVLVFNTLKSLFAFQSNLPQNMP